MRGRIPFMLLLASCATGGKLRTNADVLEADVGLLRASSGGRCAPAELALAEANVDFARHDMNRGEAGLAKQHLAIAQANVEKAFDLSNQCGQQRKPEIVRIDRADRDGDGVPDDEDRCPDLAGSKENHGCPAAKDTDGDGVADDIDRCPLDPEDKDGFQDEDGCPDPDNDGDGIVDAMDACPNNPGPLDNQGCPLLDRDADGVPDKLDKCPDEPGLPPDGCPKKYGLVEVKKDRIEIRQQVHFASNRFRILRDSFSLLDQVVQVLRDYPQMRIRIEGHTDNVGGATKNLKLSQKRADAVQAYMISKGLDPVRLQPVGFGLTRPIASNRTARGKAQNRRTEFHILATE